MLVTPTPPTSGSEALAASPRIVPFHAPTLQGALSSSTRHDALMEAHERAVADGHRTGMERARHEAAELRARLANSIEQAEAAARALRDAASSLATRDALALRDFERAACELAIELAESVIGRALAEPEVVLDAMRAALQLVPRRDATTVRVHPDDVEVVRAALEEMDLPDGSRIAPDTTVERGRCVVDVGACRIDLQVAGALDRARASIADLGGPLLSEPWQ